MKFTLVFHAVWKHEAEELSKLFPFETSCSALDAVHVNEIIDGYEVLFCVSFPYRIGCSEPEQYVPRCQTTCLQFKSVSFLAVLERHYDRYLAPDPVKE